MIGYMTGYFVDLEHVRKEFDNLISVIDTFGPQDTRAAIEMLKQLVCREAVYIYGETK